MVIWPRNRHLAVSGGNVNSKQGTYAGAKHVDILHTAISPECLLRARPRICGSTSLRRLLGHVTGISGDVERLADSKEAKLAAGYSI